MEGFHGIPLLDIKMMPPVIRENLVHRRHLTEQLERGIEQGFILVSSPPGYGKTTLVADWAQQNASPVAWLSLDTNDNDLLVFNRYLKRLFEKPFFTGKQPLDDLPPEGNTMERYQALLAVLINACSKSGSDFSLVLDDYHVIENPQIHEGLYFLLDHFPAHLRLIIITRQDPPFPLSRLRANHRILELHAPELAFSLDETRQFLYQTRRLDLSPTDVNQLYDRTEGWIAGLQLVSLAKNESSLINQPDMRISSKTNLTLEYMVDEVITLQPESTQNFLLRTSILNNLYGPLCDYILEPFSPPSSSQDLLHSLYHSNLFLIALDYEEHWFRYHSLFADALRHLLAEKYPAEVSTLYTRASEWCDQHGFYEAALTYANVVNDRARTITLLEKYTIEALKSNQILEVLGRIRMADENIFSSSPVLCVIYSWGYLLSLNIDMGEIWLNKASALMKKNDSETWFLPIENEILGLIAAGQSILAAAHGNMDQSMEFSRQALCLLPEENDFSHSFALLNQGIALSLNGEVNKAIQILRHTIRISQKSGNWFVMMIARSNLGEILIDSGQLSQALIVFEQSLNFFSTMPGKFSVLEGYIYKELSAIYLARNQLSEAEKFLEKSMESKDLWLPTFNDLDTHIHLAFLYRCQGNFIKSREELSLARRLSVASQAELDDLIVDLYEVKWALLRGQISPAQRWIKEIGLEEQTNYEHHNGMPFMIADDVQMVVARFYLVQGRLTDDDKKYALAIAWLKPLLASLIDAGLIEHQIEAYVLLALTYHELGQIDDMLLAFHSALKLAEPEEFRQVFLDEGIPMSRLLLHYLAAQKQNKFDAELPSRNFVSDLLFRLTGKEAERDNKTKQTEDEAEKDVFLFDLLTARENEVLQLVARGRSNNEIALDLHISVNTVKRHLNNVFMKLGVSTRTQAIRVAQQKGFIQ